MKSKKFLLFLVLTLIISVTGLFSCSEHHDHSHGDEHSDHDSHNTESGHGHKDHSDKDDHGDNHVKDTTDTHHEHGKHAHENRSALKAVKDACEEKGIVLSPEAISSLGIKVSRASGFSKGNGSYRIPMESLVYYENKVCVYYLKGNWYNMTDVRIVKTNGDSVLIKSSVIRNRYSIVIKGAGLLRLAHLEAFGASGHGHVH